MGYEIREENIAREALYLADEVFMTGTAAEIVPVRSVDKITVGEGKRGPITEKFKQLTLVYSMALLKISGAG